MSNRKSRGNVQQLTEMLQGKKLEDKKSAMKIIIGAMTRGEDVSQMFSPVNYQT